MAAKGQTAVKFEKAPKSKTPAQIAKREANIAEYNRRCYELRRNQEFTKFLRGLGYTGSDADVLSKGLRFANNCRSLYCYSGSNEEVIEQYNTAVRAVKNRKLAA